ncbi:MAG TPA: gliding motility-associated C-terminal domain-containing protein, partial [Arachidicoccus soli]|nr:gliding motility-associated C-terminal domain-containing protein [Arachidicoccus soli]
RLAVKAIGGSSPYTYQWMLNGNVVGNTDSVYVVPNAPSNAYYVIVGELCGSPTTSDTVEVDFPSPVNIGILPDTIGGCAPVTIGFDNTTNTNEGVDHTIWTFSDGENAQTQGLDSIAHEFGVGVYGVKMEVVTNRGCHYVQNFPDLIEGYNLPEASFYVTPNPASVIEPRVRAYSQSDPDIIAYKWYTDSTVKPFYSSLQNPTFNYPNEVGEHNLMLVVENSHQCFDTLVKIVKIQNEVLLFAPNTFTPDGDKFNGTWSVSITGINIYNFHLQIYNRWGELIFESFDPSGVWDGTYGGKIVPDGTYIWHIRTEDAINDNKYEFKGTVNVIR